MERTMAPGRAKEMIKMLVILKNLDFLYKVTVSIETRIAVRTGQHYTIPVWLEASPVTGTGES
jgi:hypothetical protein